MECRVGVVGGGAAGMTAAIAAAREGVRVTLLEGNDRLGKKLLSTGNGKCNLGNEKLDREAYYTKNPDFLESCFEKFGTEETISFFEGLGLLVKSKNGYLYPLCEQASAVLDVLRYEVSALGVEVVMDCKVERVSWDESGKRFQVQGAGRLFCFDRVILACGGEAAPKTGSDGSGFCLAKQLGHSVTRRVPALVQLKCSEDYFKAVSGVRAEAEVAVFCQGSCVARERGELQITDYGISGIPVFQLSRVVNYLLEEDRERRLKGKGIPEKALPITYRSQMGGKKENKKEGEIEIRIDFFPGFSQAAYGKLVADRAAHGKHHTVEEFFTGLLHKKLMLLFIRLSGLKPTEDADKADVKKKARVYELCRDWRVHVIGSNSYDSAQVCAGGVPLLEVTERLESRLRPGLYFAGELLDVDGKCGGYNLQWAWSSGFLAGKGAAQAAD